MAFSHIPTQTRQWFSRLAAPLDVRSSARLVGLLLGVILARGRQTITNWIATAGLSCQFRPAYTTVAAVGKRTDAIAAQLVRSVVQPLIADCKRLTFAIDDTPTPRYGPHVQGAGIHHNPTPGPVGSRFVYGHVWVTLALVLPHPKWEMIALPLLSRMYVREKDVSAIPESERPEFRTKLVMAVEMLRFAHEQFHASGKDLWVVMDGAYAGAPVLKPAIQMGFTVVSRLRCDAALTSLPAERVPGKRGRPRIYGTERIDLAERAANPANWLRGSFRLYGQTVEKEYQTFEATWRPAGGKIRVVMVNEPTGWIAFFSTNVEASATDILETVASRMSIETMFRDAKQSAGLGQQQARKMSTNVGSTHLCWCAMTMTEAWAWNQPEDQISDRSESPWDDPKRRPSHAEKRKAFRREVLRQEIIGVLGNQLNQVENADLVERILDLAA